jgi:hypothetical protein
VPDQQQKNVLSNVLYVFLYFNLFIPDINRPDPLRSSLQTVQDEFKIRGPVVDVTYPTISGTYNDDQNNRKIDRQGYISGTLDRSRLGDPERSRHNTPGRSETTYPGYQQKYPNNNDNIDNTSHIPDYSATARPGSYGDGLSGQTDSRAPHLPTDVNLQQNSMPGSSGKTDKTKDSYIPDGVDSQRLRPDDSHRSSHIPGYIGPILGGSSVNKPNANSLVPSGAGSLPRGLENSIGIGRPGQIQSNINKLQPGGIKFDHTQAANIPIYGHSEIPTTELRLQPGSFINGIYDHPGVSGDTFGNSRSGTPGNVNFQRGISKFFGTDGTSENTRLAYISGYPQNAQHGVGTFYQGNPGNEQFGKTFDSIY